MTVATPAHDPVIDAMPAALATVFGHGSELRQVQRLGGGASKEAWGVDLEVDGRLLPLLVRRMGGGVLHDHALSLAAEHSVIAAAHDAGVPVPRPRGYLPDLAGRDAFVMDRIAAEGIGRRIVQREEFAPARTVLAEQMGRALAAIHRVPLADLDILPEQDSGQSPADRVLRQLRHKLDEADEPHPVIEAGLAWLRRHRERSGADFCSEAEVLVHGDFRIGNLLVDESGLVAVIDWEFAHRGHPLEDLAWPLVRAWRFGRDAERCGGVGSAATYLAAYNEDSGSRYTETELLWWELAGNVRWAISCLTQARRHLGGAERNVELAVLGRLASEVELDILHLLREARDAGQA